MKRTIYLFTLVVLFVFRTGAQEPAKTAEYVVPAAYHFDYKVSYEISRGDHNNSKNKGKEELKSPEITNYYFTTNGEYMGMEPPQSEKESEMHFMVSTKDGLMITFGEESASDHSGKNHKTITVMDMRGMLKGSGETMTAVAKALAKNLPKKDKVDTEKEKSVELDNFKKTGRTKQVFGYTAEEYSKKYDATEEGKAHSGTMSYWYAKVDFDPEMMFSMGMGSLASPQSQAKMQQSHPNSMIGMGMTQKNWLLVEIHFEDNGGDSGSPMKVVSIDKTGFDKRTEGYLIKNYSGMSLMEMMQKESETNK